MFFRSLLHKKFIANMEISLSFQKEALDDLYNDPEISEKELLKSQEDFKDMDSYLKNRTKEHARICDVADVALFAMIASFVSRYNGFLLGQMISETVTLFAMIYGIWVIKNSSRYLYLPLAIWAAVSLTISIIRYIQ